MARKATRTAIVRPLEPDSMGRMGESLFEQLCEAGNLIAADSRRADKMGWDYHVEFPHPHQHTGVPFDSRPKMPDMKIQIKTIWSDRSTVDVGLAAADRLAGWDYLSFIVLLRINMDLTFKDIHVIHLIDNNLAMILKALRRAEAENSLSIKKKTITFGIQHGVEIAVDGRALAHAFRAAIGDEPDEYVIRKREQRKSLGFGPRPVSMNVSLAAENENEVLDIFLGLKTGRATNFEMDEIRFGIPLPKAREQGATLQIRPQSQGPCELVMTSSVGDRKRAIFNADLYMASTMTPPLGAWKVRVCSPIIELSCSRDDDRGAFTIGAKPDLRISLQDAARIVRAQLIIAFGRGQVMVRKGGTCLLTFTIDQQPSPESQEKAKNYLKFLSGLESLLREIDIPDIVLNNDDITLNFVSIDFALRAQRPNNDIAFCFKARPKESGSPIPPETEGIFAWQILFPEVTIALWASMNVTSTQEGDVAALNCSGMRLRGITQLSGDQSFDDFVDEASAEAGISLVIKAGVLGWSEDTVQKVANYDDPPNLAG
jgi:hypothetical protein